MKIFSTLLAYFIVILLIVYLFNNVSIWAAFALIILTIFLTIKLTTKQIKK